MTFSRNLLLFAALNGAMSVAVGAFGAHGVPPEAKALLTTGGQYQMVHALMAAVLSIWPSAGRAGRVAGWLAATGGLIFCTTLLLIAMAGMRYMGAVTPVGGTLMIIGWLVLAWRAVHLSPVA